MLCSLCKLLPAVKRNGTDEHVVQAHSPVTGAAHTSHSEDMQCPALTVNDSRWTTAVEDDDCGAALRRGQPSRPSHWTRTAKQRWALGSAARVREGHECPCTPYDVAVRSRLGSSCSVQRWRRTVGPIGSVHTPGSLLCTAHLSAVLRTRQCREKLLPNSRTHANEPSVTRTPHLGIEQP